MRKTTDKLCNLLNFLGVKREYLGVRYLECAMELLDADNAQSSWTGKMLYQEIARMNSTSAACVERNLRTLAEIIDRNGRLPSLGKAVEFPFCGQPTNGELLHFLRICVQDSCYEKFQTAFLNSLEQGCGK